MTQQQLEELKNKIERATAILRKITRAESFTKLANSEHELRIEFDGDVGFFLNRLENPVLYDMIANETVRRLGSLNAELEAL